MKIRVVLLMIILTATIFSCNNQQGTGENEAGTDSVSKVSMQPSIREETVSYEADGKSYQSFVAYDDNVQGKRPVILVVHEWWGLNDYPKARARQVAAMGYMAMAVDMFGNGDTAANPQQAQQMATPFYANPQLARSGLDAGLSRLSAFSQADTSQVAAIGYCFGGNVVLNAAKLGAPYKGVVSFHGNLAGAPAKKDLLKASLLVCHGETDKFISEAEISGFKKSMDSIDANYTFKTYPNATHAFTNPAATETGRKFNLPIEYNAAADTASWNDMKIFLENIFK
jgi:dienelactone hydrolase